MENRHGQRIVELQEAEHLPPVAEGDERHGLVPGRQAAAPVATGPGRIREPGARQGVGPEASLLREAREGRIETAPQNVPAEAGELRHALIVPGGSAIRAVPAERVLPLDEGGREPLDLEIRKILPVAKTQPHGGAPRPPLNDGEHASDELAQVSPVVQELEEGKGDLPLPLAAADLGDVMEGP